MKGGPSAAESSCPTSCLQAAPPLARPTICLLDRLSARRPSIALASPLLLHQPVQPRTRPTAQTLRMPRQPAPRTARATCPARPTAPASCKHEPATHTPRPSSAPATVTDLSLCRVPPQDCWKPSSNLLRGLGAAQRLGSIDTMRVD